MGSGEYSLLIRLFAPLFKFVLHKDFQQNIIGKAQKAVGS